jgi:predicted nucleic acid-binding protein
VSAEPAFGDGVFIADKSAWDRSSSPRVAEEWQRALSGRQILTCPVVNMELLYSAPTADVFDELEELLRALRDIPISRSVTNAAIAAMRELAYKQPTYHRVRLPDALIAAAAQDVGVGVLHYDQHYDRLAEVMSFDSRWVAPPGSL